MTQNSLAYLRHTDVNSGNPVRILCTQITPSYNCRAESKPNANYGQLARVQSQNFENPLYSVQNIKLGISGSLTLSLLKDFIAANYSSTSPLYLSFKYGGSWWTSYGTSATDIPVQLNGNISLALDTRDSKDAYRPSFNMTFVEQYEAA